MVLAETLATLGVHRTVGAESICDVLLLISTEMHVTIRPPRLPPPLCKLIAVNYDGPKSRFAYLIEATTASTWTPTLCVSI